MNAHRRAHADPDLWRSLREGQVITVVKLTPEGEEAARYPAAILVQETPERWLAVQATWTYQEVALDGLVFSPGDTLVEWFSAAQPFNAFAVLSPAGELRGWYANVTFPAYVVPAPDDPDAVTLYWHDLYLDLVGLPDGRYTVRDEDELASSGLAATDTRLHDEIVAACDELVRRFTQGRLPFVLPNASVAVSRNEPAVPE